MTQGQLRHPCFSTCAPGAARQKSAHRKETQYDSEFSHTSISDLIKATALSHSHFPGAVHRISVQFTATLSGKDKTTETKVGSIMDALNNASTDQLCHYFVRSYLKDLAHNKLHGA